MATKSFQSVAHYAAVAQSSIAEKLDGPDPNEFILEWRCDTFDLAAKLWSHAILGQEGDSGWPEYGLKDPTGVRLAKNVEVLLSPTLVCSNTLSLQFGHREKSLRSRAAKP